MKLFPKPVHVVQNDVVQLAVWLLFDDSSVAYHFSLHLIGLTDTMRQAALPSIEAIPQMTDALEAARNWVKAQKTDPNSLAVRLTQSLSRQEEHELVC